MSREIKEKWPNFTSLMKSNPGHSSPSFSFDDNSSVQLLLGVIGAPLSNSNHKIRKSYKLPNCLSQKSSMAKYSIHQYVAAMGGEHALNSVESMYAMGKVAMMASEGSGKQGLSTSNNKKLSNSNVKKVKGTVKNGGFVLWSKGPDLWCLELVVSATKINAGCDGKVAWTQTPWHHSQSSRGPPRPLRRSLQGLDPRLTANLFTNSICVGERKVDAEDCFTLKLEANPTTLAAMSTSTSMSMSSSNIRIIRHTIFGYFSQRTGFLVQLQDSHLLKKKKSMSDYIFYETTIESSIQDYRTIDGINIAHSGKTSVSLSQYGKNNKTRMEEVWSIEEVDFNVKGLITDFFLPPTDLKKDDQVGFSAVLPNNTKSTSRLGNAVKFGKSKVFDIIDDY